MIIAIDVDNVLRNLTKKMCEMYNTSFHENINYKTIKHYEIKNIFPILKKTYGEHAREWFFSCRSKEVFCDAEPMNENIAYIVGKIKQNNKVVIVTRQDSLENKIDTLMWLKNNHIEYDSIVFASDKSIVDCDYLIDDYIPNLENSIAKNKILINQPYNVNEDVPYRRYDSLNDFYNKELKDYEEEQDISW